MLIRFLEESCLCTCTSSLFNVSESPTGSDKTGCVLITILTPNRSCNYTGCLTFLASVSSQKLE